MIIQHLFTFDNYAAFLKASGLEPTELAAGYMQYEGDNLQNDLANTEQLGFYKNNKLTVKAEKIAKVICEPEKTILIDNPAAGEHALCIYNYFKGLWIYIVIDFKMGMVSLTSPILPDMIKTFVTSSTLGNWRPASKEQISFSLTNDEAALLNISMFLIGKAFKKVGRPLTKEESMINLKTFDRDFLAELLVADCSSGNTMLSLYEDEHRYETAIAGLIEKGFLTKTEKEDTYLHGEKARKYMLPNGGCIRISYKDLGTDNCKKYSLSKERLFEITSSANSVTFSTIDNIDFSFWKTPALNVEPQEVKQSQPVAAAQQTSEIPANTVSPAVNAPEQAVIQPVVEEKQPEITQKNNESPSGFTFKFCPFCGSKVVLQGQFCTNCGKKFPER